jgi:hypothetical protein
MCEKLDVMQIGESMIKDIQCEFDGGFVNTMFQGVGNRLQVDGGIGQQDLVDKGIIVRVGDADGPQGIVVQIVITILLFFTTSENKMS